MAEKSLYDLVQEIRPAATNVIVHTDYCDIGLTALDLVWEQDSVRKYLRTFYKP